MSAHEITREQSRLAVVQGTKPCASCRFSDYTVPQYPKCRAVFGDDYCKSMNPNATCSMHERVPSPAAVTIDLTPIAWCGFWIMWGLIAIGMSS